MPTPFFVHVPKTAGSLIRTLITANYESKAVLSLYGSRADIFTECRKNIGKLKDIQLIQGHTPYGTHHWIGEEKPAYFSFLRDPIARTLSDIDDGHRHAVHGFHHILSQVGPDPFERLSLVKDLTYYRNNMTHFLSGTFYTREIGLTEFNLAVDNLWKSAFVGLTEHCEESILIMGRLLGWTHFVPQKCNVAPAPLPSLSPEAISLCNTFLDYDIQLYHVALDHFDRLRCSHGAALAEAAEQLREILHEQSKHHPDTIHKPYLVGTPLEVPLQGYTEKLMPSSPLGRWISASYR